MALWGFDAPRDRPAPPIEEMLERPTRDDFRAIDTQIPQSPTDEILRALHRDLKPLYTYLKDVPQRVRAYLRR